MNAVWRFTTMMAKIVSMAAVFSFAIGCLAGFATLVHHVVVDLLLHEAGVPREHEGSAIITGALILIFFAMGLVMVIYAAIWALKAIGRLEEDYARTESND